MRRHIVLSVASAWLGVFAAAVQAQSDETPLPQPVKFEPSSQEFIARAARGDAAEIEIAQLALSRSQNAALRTFAQHTRNTLDLAAVPAVRRISHLPIIIDASHGTGKNYRVTPLARAGVAVGADGLMIEVHSKPEEALSDGAQALTLDEFEQMANEVRAIHEVIS